MSKSFCLPKALNARAESTSAQQLPTLLSALSSDSTKAGIRQGCNYLVWCLCLLCLSPVVRSALSTNGHSHLLLSIIKSMTATVYTTAVAQRVTAQKQQTHTCLQSIVYAFVFVQLPSTRQLSCPCACTVHSQAWPVMMTSLSVCSTVKG